MATFETRLFVNGEDDTGDDLHERILLHKQLRMHETRLEVMHELL